jgi:hypothetical protein
MDTPCTSILLAVERDMPCTFILLAFERETPCMSILLARKEAHLLPYLWFNSPPPSPSLYESTVYTDSVWLGGGGGGVLIPVGDHMYSAGF